MNDRQKNLLFLGGIYLAGGIIALILLMTGFNADSLKKRAEENKIRESLPSETFAQEPEERPEEAPDVEEETGGEEEKAAETEAEEEEPEAKEEEAETAGPETEEPEEAETPALGPEGKPLTVLAETAKVYKSFKTLNREKILHVRVAPDINSEIIARLSPGTEGLVLEVGDHWSRIRSFDGTITGYCSNEYLTFTDISPEEFQRLKKDI